MSAALDALPASAVSIGQVSDRGSRAPVIVFQDIHLNPEAQENLRTATERLLDSGLTESIHMEGAFGPLDFRAFRAFSAPTRDALTRDLVRLNAVGGPSAAIVSSTAETRAVGADDEAAYRRNVKAIRVCRVLRPDVAAAIDRLSREVATAKSAVFGPRLREFDRVTSARSSGHLSYGEAIERLSALGLQTSPDLEDFLEAHRIERTLDFGRVDRERRAAIEILAHRVSPEEAAALSRAAVEFRNGRLGFAGFYRRLADLFRRHGVRVERSPALREYLRYVALSDRIDASRLLAHVDGAERRLAERLASSPEERRLVRMDRALFLARRLCRFEMTPWEWERWESEEAVLPGALARMLSPFEDFYREADHRTAALARSVLSGGGKKARVLVVGGFHAPELVRRLADGGAPFALVSPRVSRADADPTAYLSVFTREKSPLERLFDGERLTVNPAALVWGGANAESVGSGLNFLARAAALDAARGSAVDPLIGIRSVDGVFEATVGDRRIRVAVGSVPDGYQALDEEPVAETTVVAARAGWPARIRSGLAGMLASESPGSWALVWRGPVNVVARIAGEKLALKLRPLIAGFGEGLIVSAIALLAPGSVTAILAWFAMTMAFHYVFGVYHWNNSAGTWDIRRYLRRADEPGTGQTGEYRLAGFILSVPDRHFFRANLVAATSVLGFFSSAIGAGVTLTVALSVIPHVIVSLVRERKIDEERRRATEERKRQFVEALEIVRIVDDENPPSEAERGRLADWIESRNDLASFLRFNRSQGGRYRLALIMQPGSTSDAEGPGFKKFNDTLGYDMMNRVWRFRNDLVWREAQAVFDDLNRRVGRPVIEPVAGGYKSLRFAIDIDAIAEVHPDPGEREREIRERLNQVVVRSSKALALHMTADEPSGANRDIVSAVRIAQSKGRLPKRFPSVPLYWGLSAPAERGDLDGTLVADAQTVAAVNTVRSNPAAVRSLGKEFSIRDLRDTLAAIGRLRDELRRHGVLETLRDDNGGAPVLPSTLVDAFRKKKRAQLVAMLRDRHRQSEEQAPRTHDLIRSYISLLGVFDNIKPWVGSAERAEALSLASDLNRALEEIARLATPGVDARAEWRRLRPLLRASLARDARAPFLGSPLEFYGRSVPGNESDEVAALFVDFRAFGALIANELERAAERLRAVADASDDDALAASFAAEMLSLGDRSLDPFAASLRRVRSDLESEFGSEAGLRFYFGGDDVTVILPRRLVFGESPDHPDAGFLERIFSRVPEGSRIRVVIASNTPYLERKDPVLSVALALADADELAAEAKKAEESWKPRGALVPEVVVYADRGGAHHRAPVFDRRPGRPELTHPGHDDTATWAVKELMAFHRRWINRSADDVAARQWAETKAEESILLLAAFVALVELPLLPGIPVLLNNFVGPAAAIVAGAVIMVLFHELTVFVSWVRRIVTRHVLHRRVPRPLPPGPWTGWLPVRMGARFAASLVILSIAFMPLYPGMLPGHLIPLDALGGLVPTFTVAWLSHTLWNIYVPPAWRLSLMKMPDGAYTRPNPDHPDENQDTPLSIDLPVLGARVRGVADGHGGARVGRISSRAFVRGARKRLRMDAAGLPDPRQTVEIDHLVLVRNALLAGAAESMYYTDQGRSVVSLALQIGRRLYVAQAGDASTYLFTDHPANGRSLTKVNLDNLRLSDIPAPYIVPTPNGPWGAVIDRDVPLLPPLDERLAREDAVLRMSSIAGQDRRTMADFQRRNEVANTIGDPQIFPVIYKMAIPEASRAWLIQMSDGITDNLTPDEIEAIVANAATPADASRRLVDAARSRMKTVARSRAHLKVLHDLYGDAGLIPPGTEEDNRALYEKFVAPGRRAPFRWFTGNFIATWFYRVRQDLRSGNAWVTPSPVAESALAALDALVSEPNFIRARPDDAVAVTTDITTDLTTSGPAMASMADRWMLRRFGPDHWFYSFYSLVLVHWELAFFAPLLLAPGPISAVACGLVMAAAFAGAHPERTTPERIVLFRAGVVIALSGLTGAALLGSAWGGAGLAAVAHSTMNWRELVRLRRASRSLEAARRFSGSNGGRSDLVELVSSLPLKLGVGDIDANVMRQASESANRGIAGMNRAGLIGAHEADAMWRSFSERLRESATGRREPGLVLLSSNLLDHALRADAKDGGVGGDVVAVRFIDTSAAQGIDAARSWSRNPGGPRTVFVVRGNHAAVDDLVRGKALVIPWSERLRMTDVESLTAEWIARREGLAAASAAELIRQARFRMLVPHDFGLTDEFLSGIRDLSRFRVFVLLVNSLLAVEIRPSALRDAVDIARIIGRQA